MTNTIENGLYNVKTKDGSAGTYGIMVDGDMGMPYRCRYSTKEWYKAGAAMKLSDAQLDTLRANGVVSSPVMEA